jgi:hypothetical protein
MIERVHVYSDFGSHNAFQVLQPVYTYLIPLRVVSLAHGSQAARHIPVPQA